MFINLVQNAFAACGSGGNVRVSSEDRSETVVYRVEDDGALASGFGFVGERDGDRVETGIDDCAEIVLLDSQSPLFQQITGFLDTRSDVQSIHLVS